MAGQWLFAPFAVPLLEPPFLLLVVPFLLVFACFFPVLPPLVPRSEAHGSTAGGGMGAGVVGFPSGDFGGSTTGGGSDTTGFSCGTAGGPTGDGVGLSIAGGPVAGS